MIVIQHGSNLAGLIRGTDKAADALDELGRVKRQDREFDYRKGRDEQGDLEREQARKDRKDEFAAQQENARQQVAIQHRQEDRLQAAQDSADDWMRYRKQRDELADADQRAENVRSLRMILGRNPSSEAYGPVYEGTDPNSDLPPSLQVELMNAIRNPTAARDPASIKMYAEEKLRLGQTARIERMLSRISMPNPQAQGPQTAELRREQILPYDRAERMRGLLRQSKSNPQSVDLDALESELFGFAREANRARAQNDVLVSAGLQMDEKIAAVEDRAKLDAQHGFDYGGPDLQTIEDARALKDDIMTSGLTGHALYSAMREFDNVLNGRKDGKSRSASDKPPESVEGSEAYYKFVDSNPMAQHEWLTKQAERMKLQDEAALQWVNERFAAWQASKQYESEQDGMRQNLQGLPFETGGDPGAILQGGGKLPFPGDPSRSTATGGSGSVPVGQVPYPTDPNDDDQVSAYVEQLIATKRIKRTPSAIQGAIDAIRMNKQSTPQEQIADAKGRAELARAEGTKQGEEDARRIEAEAQDIRDAEQAKMRQRLSAEKGLERLKEDWPKSRKQWARIYERAKDVGEEARNTGRTGYAVDERGPMMIDLIAELEALGRQKGWTLPRTFAERQSLRQEKE